MKRKSDVCSSKVTVHAHIDDRFTCDEAWHGEKLFNIGQNITKKKVNMFVILLNPNSYKSIETIPEELKVHVGIGHVSADGPPYRIAARIIENNWAVLVPGLWHLHKIQIVQGFG